MWMETRKGKYRYSERYSDPLTGKLRKVSVTLDRKSDKKAIDLLQKKIKQLSRPEASFRLKEVADLYLKDQKKTVQDSTYLRNKGIINILVDMLGGDNLIDRLTAAYIRKQMLDTDKKATTLNEYIKRFRSFARWAYRNNYLSSTQCIDKLVLFEEPPKRRKLENKFLESADFRRLLADMEDEGYRLITEFLGLSGLRIGEVIALNTSDIVGLSVDIGKNYGLNTHKIHSTKTESSFRVLHLQPELKDCADRLTAFMERRKFLIGKDIPYWIVTRKGKRLGYDAYLNYLKATSEKVLGRSISPHVLRHTHASLLAENDVNLGIISRRLGHKDSKVTRDIYTHVTERRQKKDAEVIDTVSILCPHSAPKVG